MHINVYPDKIAIIGDSWVTLNLSSAIKRKLLLFGIGMDVICYSYPGATSRQLCYKLISDNLLKVDTDYFVIIAGVNDTIRHVGKDSFVQHMLYIISAINAYNKYPMILEVPEFGIEEKEAFLPALKHGLYRYLFDNGKVDVISDYRHSLQMTLSETQYKYRLIPFSEIATDYKNNTDKYSNAYHLNMKGNELLGAVIGESILQYFHTY